MKVEQERRAIRVRKRRRETEDANLSGVLDSDQLLREYVCAHIQTHTRKQKREKKGDTSKKLFDPRRDASSCCASLSISNEGCR